MRRFDRSRPAGRLGLAIALAVGIGCTTAVPPQTRVLSTIDPDVPQMVYVVTNDEREAVLGKLRRAGFEIANDPTGAPGVLHVRFGNSRASRECGWVRNVSYDLRLNSVRVAVIKGRGWTGSCSPNILGAMSDELARLYSPAHRESTFQNMER